MDAKLVFFVALAGFHAVEAMTSCESDCVADYVKCSGTDVAGVGGCIAVCVATGPGFPLCAILACGVAVGGGGVTACAAAEVKCLNACHRSSLALLATPMLYDNAKVVSSDGLAPSRWKFEDILCNATSFTASEELAANLSSTVSSPRLAVVGLVAASLQPQLTCNFHEAGQQVSISKNVSLATCWKTWKNVWHGRGDVSSSSCTGSRVDEAGRSVAISYTVRIGTRPSKHTQVWKYLIDEHGVIVGLNVSIGGPLRTNTSQEVSDLAPTTVEMAMMNDGGTTMCMLGIVIGSMLSIGAVVVSKTFRLVDKPRVLQEDDLAHALMKSDEKQ